jgi:5-enolpyruvylshikimate-3-phosphate synthase
MAIMSLSAKRPFTIRDVDCTETSYPGFWQLLERMGGHVEPSDCD